jgi:hypothetical protein
MADIRTVTPEDPRYADVNRTLTKHLDERIDYAELADQYNPGCTGTIILFKAPQRFKLSNIRKTLARRGLIAGVDYSISRLREDAHGTQLPAQLRPVALKRLTDALMSRD